MGQNSLGRISCTFPKKISSKWTAISVYMPTTVSLPVHVQGSAENFSAWPKRYSKLIPNIWSFGSDFRK